MNKALEKEVTTKTTFKGHLDSYRFCDQVRMCLNLSGGKHCGVEKDLVYITGHAKPAALGPTWLCRHAIMALCCATC